MRYLIIGAVALAVIAFLFWLCGAVVTAAIVRADKH